MKRTDPLEIAEIEPDEECPANQVFVRDEAPEAAVRELSLLSPIMK
jgi:hypothetical protein